MPGMPPGDSTDAARYEAVVALVREHSKRYSRDELRERIIENGYDPADVERAMASQLPERPVPLWLLLSAAFQIALTVVLTLNSRDFVPMTVVWALWVWFVIGILLGLLGPTRRLGRVLVVGTVVCEIVVIGGLVLLIGLCRDSAR